LRSYKTIILFVKNIKTKKGGKQIQKNTFNRILLPVDGSAISKKAIQKALFIADTLSLPILAIQVLELPLFPSYFPLAVSPSITYGPMSPQYYPLPKKEEKKFIDTLKNQARDRLQQIVQLGKEKRIDVKTEILIGSADEKIIGLSEPGDLIVMGAKGHSSFMRIFIGNVSENVLHHSKSSVMIVR
jgi:nucleotide-binding universal stress UspA family protein